MTVVYDIPISKQTECQIFLSKAKELISSYSNLKWIFSEKENVDKKKILRHSVDETFKWRNSTEENEWANNGK